MSTIKDFDAGRLPFKIPDLRVQQRIEDLGRRYRILARGLAYGAETNWHIYKPLIPAFRDAIRMWRADQIKVPSLRALAWELTHSPEFGDRLWEFNERHQRGYLKAGLRELLDLLDEEARTLSDKPLL